MLPETKNIALEEMGRLFGDEEELSTYNREMLERPVSKEDKRESIEHQDDVIKSEADVDV